MNKSEPKRVLHIIEKIEKNNGVTAVALNYFRHIKREDILFDFVVHGESEKDLESEILQLGGRIFHFPTLQSKHIKSCRAQMEKLLSSSMDKYKVIHCHLPNAAFIYLAVAKRFGVPVRILHSHNSMGSDKLLKRFRNNLLNKLGLRYANRYMACSKVAASYLFGQDKDVFLLNNAIDLDIFNYNNNERNKIRQRLGVENSIVLGHVGRFVNQKNHMFLLRLLKSLLDVNSNYRLLLIGGGELEESIYQKSVAMNISEHIIFAGIKSDVNKYLLAMDCFLLPSLFEGLPLVGIEAQATGLTCLFSDQITKNVKVTDNAYFLSLDEHLWKQKIEALVFSNEDTRKSETHQLTKNGYNIASEADKLSQYYKQWMNHNDE